MDTLSWATNSPPRFSGESFVPGCPASLVSDEVFFRKPFRHVNNDSDPVKLLYSPFVGMRDSHARNLYSEFIGIPYSHARNLYSEFIGIPYSHGPESATKDRDYSP